MIIFVPVQVDGSYLSKLGKLGWVFILHSSAHVMLFANYGSCRQRLAQEAELEVVSEAIRFVVLHNYRLLSFRWIVKLSWRWFLKLFVLLFLIIYRLLSFRWIQSISR